MKEFLLKGNLWWKRLQKPLFQIMLLHFKFNQNEKYVHFLQFNAFIKYCINLLFAIHYFIISLSYFVFEFFIVFRPIGKSWCNLLHHKMKLSGYLFLHLYIESNFFSLFQYTQQEIIRLYIIFEIKFKYLFIFWALNFGIFKQIFYSYFTNCMTTR